MPKQIQSQWHDGHANDEERMGVNMKHKWLLQLMMGGGLLTAVLAVPVAMAQQDPPAEASPQEQIADTPSQQSTESELPAPTSGTEANVAQAESSATSETVATIPVPDATPVAPAADADSSVAILDEVVVTAQKRSENLQSVAAAVTAISGQDIRRRGLNNIEDVTRSIPNVTMTSENLIGVYNVRGMGAPTSGNFDPSITAIVDDVPLPAGYLSFAFLDMESIEVLRGPQGTLYGRNNVAGVFKVATNEPNYFWSGSANVRYGSFNTKRYEGIANVPLVDGKAAARFKFVNDSRDGYITNTYRNEDDGRSGRTGLGGKFLLDLSTNVSLTLNALYEKVDQPHGWGYQAITCPNYYIAVAKTVDRGFECSPNLTASRNEAELQKGDAFLGSAVLSWQLGDYQIKTFASYYDYGSFVFYDADYSPLPLLTLPLEVGGDALTAEIRLISPDDLLDGKLSFVSGLLYSHEHALIDTSLNLLNIPCVLPALCTFTNTVAVESIRQYSLKGVDEKAIFAQGSYKLAGPLDLTMGARYTEVDTTARRIENSDKCAGLSIPCVLGSAAGIADRETGGIVRTDRDISYKGALRYFVNDKFLTYASVATGFKSGGFGLTLSENGGEVMPDDYEPERSISYEIGTKITLLGGAARVNISAFQSEFTNLQVPLQKLFIAENSNAAKAQTRGVELESMVLLPGSIRLSANGSYLKARYLDYKDAPCPDQGGTPQDNDNNPATPGVCDLSGRTLANAPKWKASLILDGAWQPFSWPFRLTAGTDANWQSMVFFQSDTDPNDTQAAYWRLNARAGLAGLNEDWNIGIFVDNITDKLVLQSSNDIPVIAGGHWGSLASPRTISLGASLRFGE